MPPAFLPLLSRCVLLNNGTSIQQPSSSEPPINHLNVLFHSQCSLARSSYIRWRINLSTISHSLSMKQYVTDYNGQSNLLLHRWKRKELPIFHKEYKEYWCIISDKTHGYYEVTQKQGRNLSQLFCGTSKNYSTVMHLSDAINHQDFKLIEEDGQVYNRVQLKRCHANFFEIGCRASLLEFQPLGIDGLKRYSLLYGMIIST